MRNMGLDRVVPMEMVQGSSVCCKAVCKKYLVSGRKKSFGLLFYLRKSI